MGEDHRAELIGGWRIDTRTVRERVGCGESA
jgi:hypothetical protein